MEFSISYSDLYVEDYTKLHKISNPETLKEGIRDYILGENDYLGRQRVMPILEAGFEPDEDFEIIDDPKNLRVIITQNLNKAEN